MPIEPKEITGTQEVLLARSYAVTLEQIEIARQIVAKDFSFASGSTKDQAVIAVTGVLATNYLATVTKAA